MRGGNIDFLMLNGGWRWSWIVLKPAETGVKQAKMDLFTISDHLKLP